MITNIDKNNIRILEDAILNALNGVEKEFGVCITLKGGTYRGADADLKLNVEVVNKADGVKTDEQRMYDTLYKAMGLPSRGSIIATSRGREYIIEGWNARAKKYPVVIRAIGTNDTVRATVAYIKSLDLVSSST